MDGGFKPDTDEFCIYRTKHGKMSPAEHVFEIGKYKHP